MFVIASEALRVEETNEKSVISEKIQGLYKFLKKHKNIVKLVIEKVVFLLFVIFAYHQT